LFESAPKPDGLGWRRAVLTVLTRFWRSKNRRPTVALPKRDVFGTQRYHCCTPSADGRSPPDREENPHRIHASAVDGGNWTTGALVVLQTNSTGSVGAPDRHLSITSHYGIADTATGATSIRRAQPLVGYASASYD